MDENQEPSKLAKRVSDAQKAILLAKRLKVLWPIISAAAPYILLIFSVFSFVCFVFIATSENKAVIAPVATSSSTLCPNGVNVTDSKEGENGNYPLEEYVVGVVSAENAHNALGTNGNIESMKAQAIAARTYAIVITNFCTGTIQDGTSHQAYGKLSYSGTYTYDTALDSVKRAVEETKGMVLTNDGKIFLSEYDSFFCANTDGTCNDPESSGNCSCTYTKQPGLETHTLSIPKANVSEWLGGHGRGMSQVYANYLQDIMGYKYDEILKYFYSPSVQIIQYSSNATGTCNGTTFYGLADAGAFVSRESTTNSIPKLLSCVAPQVQQAFAVINNYCAYAGFSATRDINYTPGGANAATYSNHYVGRAIDIQGGGTASLTYQSTSGFLYYVTIENNLKTFPNSSFYRLYCKVVKGAETSNSFVKNNFTIQPVYYKGNSGGGPYVYDDFHNSTKVTDNFLDVTALLNSLGLYGTRPMDSCVENSSTNDNDCLEWWHFGDNSGVSGGITNKDNFNQLYRQAYGHDPYK